MSTTIELMVGAIVQKVRIFSLRGCHLLAMFARTPVVKAFRKWVLDVLDRLAQEEREASGAEVITPDQQCTIQAHVKARIEAIPENIRPKGLYPQIYSRFNNHFRQGFYKQLPQKRMSEAVTYLAQLEVKPLEIEEKPANEQREIREPLVSNVIDHDIFSGQQRIFEECAEVSRHLNIIKGWLHPTAKPGARPFNMKVEKQVLYDNMADLVTVAMCNVWALENAVKAFGRIGARVDFRK